MALEQLDKNLWDLQPGPFDVHAHPRVFDSLNHDDFPTINEGTEGKAGLRIYTEAALRSGITGIAAMPNESVRLYDESSPEKTVEIPYPIANHSRVLAMQAAIAERAVIPTAVYMGIDPQAAFWDEDKARLNSRYLSTEFKNVSEDCLGLKIYLAETTGGNTIGLEHAAAVTALWHHQNPDKPVIFHVEGAVAMRRLFNDVRQIKASESPIEKRQPIGHKIPIHIAHITSREELEAKIEAKRSGMNVSCEVTPHHVSFDESLRQELGGYGCMKPTLKTAEDVQFLRNHLHDIEIFASDCAPHRISDKERESPAYGVTNHTVMLPVLIGLAKDGYLTMEDVYQKFCVTPRQRFNLPLEDGSMTRLATGPETALLTADEHDQKAEYGQNPWTRTDQAVRLAGRVIVARAGASTYYADWDSNMRSSYRHQIRPINMKEDK